jgi:hypothetical protein
MLEGNKCSAGKRKCKLNHSVDGSHNLRVLKRELECEDLEDWSDDVLEKIVAKIGVYEEPDESDSSGSEAGAQAAGQAQSESLVFLLLIMF